MKKVIALSLGAFLAWAGEARADVVDWAFTGKVTSIDTTLWSGFEDLAALDAGDGANVVITVSFDNAVVGEPLNDTTTKYEGAIVALVVTMGGYDVSLDTDGAFNSVTVSDGAAGMGFDSTTITASITNEFAPSDTTSLVSRSATIRFWSFDGTAASDTSINQDFTAYASRQGSVDGPLGNVRFVLDPIPMLGGGGGSAGPGSPFGGLGPSSHVCQRKQRLAAATLGRKQLACRGRAAKTALLETSDEKLTTCLEKSHAAFVKAFGKLQSLSCALNIGDTVPAALELEGELEALADEVFAGMDPDNAADRALRARLLKALSRAWSRTMKAYAKHSTAFFAPIETVGEKVSAAEAALVKRATKAITVAGKKGVTYDGPDGPALAASARDAVEAFVLKTLAIELPDDT